MSTQLLGDQIVIQLTSADQTVTMPTVNTTTPPRLRLISASVLGANYGNTSNDTHLVRIRGLNITNNVTNFGQDGEGVIVPLTGDDTYWQPDQVVRNRYMSFRKSMAFSVRNQAGAAPTFTYIYLYLHAD